MIRKLVAGLLISAFTFGNAGAEPIGRLYAAASSANEVYVLDTTTNKLVDRIEVGAHPHGLAVTSDGRWLWVAVEGDGHLAKIDTSTHQVVGSWPKRRMEQELEITTDGRYIYNGGVFDGCYDVFDTVEEKVVRHIPVTGNPHNIARGARDDRYMYAAPMTVTVDKIATHMAEKVEHRQGESLQAPAREQLAAVEFRDCAGLQVDRLAPSEGIYVIDTKAQKAVGLIPTGSPPRPITLTDDGKYLYANVDGLIGFLVIDTAARKVIERVEAPKLTEEQQLTPSRSHGIAVTPDQREVWSTSVNHKYVQVFDRTGPKTRFVTQIATADMPYWIAFSADGKYGYAAMPHIDQIAVIDTSSHKVIANVQLPKGAGPKVLEAAVVPH